MADKKTQPLRKVNYQKILEDTIKEHESKSEVPTLLLHSCCAPCSSYVLEYLTKYFSITDFYYNPNIYPEAEYDHRVKELGRFIEEYPAQHPVTYEVGAYDSERFYDAVKGFENEPERGKRCEICFRLRLEESAKKARELGCDYFTTTLSISPMKDAALLNSLGAEIGEKYGVAYLYSDFKKKGGYLRSTQLSEEYGLYRQDYCGCVFSKREREAAKSSRME